MTQPEAPSRPELLAADDAAIEDAIAYADPMVLRGLLYQLTGDPGVAATGVRVVEAGMGNLVLPATEEDVALLRRKGAEFLKAYRDSGAGVIGIGPRERLPVSLGLMLGKTPEGETLQHHVEELGLDPATRSLRWRGSHRQLHEPSPCCCALCCTPRRTARLQRPGVYATVRSIISSSVAKW